MIKKFTCGNPIDTQAVVEEFTSLPINEFMLKHTLSKNDFTFEFDMEKNDIVYGLGEAIRGINKRGWTYTSFCSDDPFQTETKNSLYASHNFLLLGGKKPFGLYIDFPSNIVFDIGYTDTNKALITINGTDFDIYYIENNSVLEIVKEFRKSIGQSYIPPLWAFGFGQSRWSYPDKECVDSVISKYDEAQIPLDSVYLDIDYMQDFKDFTVDENKFPNFNEYVKSKKEHGIHLVPIIDAGVKKEDGYAVYDEGKEKGYFCKTEDGKDFEGAVWPGIVGFPDFLRKDVRDWFGSKYKYLTDMGIDGFWNDMNEPAIFYSAKELDKAIDKATELKGKNLGVYDFFNLKDAFSGLSNKDEDYKSIYHLVDGKKIRHDKVHNIYGANMTKAAGEYFEKSFGKEKILMFSRASYIGAHRSSGIWFGDNQSWWSHILLDLKMLPSANMCGFLYCGADLGGFGANATRDLVLRFLALGVFTPLMRNHSAIGTRNQECYSFGDTKDFKDIIEVRYRLIPYLYKTFKKASENNDMIFRPLSFDYPNDKIARECETQLMLGDECMIAPVYEQNVSGRTVYLPEDMTFIKLSGTDITEQKLEKGIHYVSIELNEVALFIKKGRSIKLCNPSLRTSQLDFEKAITIPNEK